MIQHGKIVAKQEAVRAVGADDLLAAEDVYKRLVLDGTIMMNSIFALPEYYLVEECSATSAGNHEWFTEMFLQQEKEEAKRLGMNVYCLLYTSRCV